MKKHSFCLMMAVGVALFLTGCPDCPNCVDPGPAPNPTPNPNPGPNPPPNPGPVPQAPVCVSLDTYPAYGQSGPVTGSLCGQVSTTTDGLFIYLRDWVNGAWKYVLKPGDSLDYIEIKSGGKFSFWPIQDENDLDASHIIVICAPKNTNANACYPALCASLPEVPGMKAWTCIDRWTGQTPSISITQIDKSQGVIWGSTTGVPPEAFGIGAYIYVGNRWVGKPGESLQLIQLDEQGDWFVYYDQDPSGIDATATYAAAALVPAWYQPNDCYPALCETLPSVLGIWDQSRI